MKLKFSGANFKPVYRDEYAREPLPSGLVHKAMCEELEYFNNTVWELVEKSEAEKEEHFKLIRTNWVVCNKGDAQDPDVRARLVACEVNTYKSDLFHASTPPLEAKKILLSQMASERHDSNGAHLQLMFVDARKAYFNAKPRRALHLLPPKELGLPKGYVARLKRCAYGTRDAGLLWEECYCEKLAAMGFVRGISSPCCFVHEAKGLRCVVHGDDFTLLGTRTSLRWFEQEFGTAFEIKIRGIFGEAPMCQKEIRILNRILRVEKWGLAFEADPRHAELLIKALGESPNSSATPGQKASDPDLDAQLNDEEEAIEEDEPIECGDMIDANAAVLRSEVHPLLTVQSTSRRRVRFQLTPAVMEIQPYSGMWGVHPSRVVVDRHGSLKKVSSSADPYTGKSTRVMLSRRKRLKAFSPARMDSAHRYRVEMVSSVFVHGSPWEWEAIQELVDDRDELIMAIRTPSGQSPAARKGRLGARAVKEIEHAEEKGELLSPPQATTFRALSARANFLAQDRPDLAFACKELCRHFSCPTVASMLKLKRLIRYLVQTPRLVYQYRWQEAQSIILTYADTDFAGCAVTRRSTSGGCVVLGSHLVKHYSSTQPTISLSSGEAELHGIAKAASHALGIRSLMADLGWQMAIEVHSDAIAAIGIARRRGVGKIRHLDTTDLWLQEKVKLGDIQLHKVPGAQNPADLLTKHLSRPQMNEHLGRLNVVRAEGRAVSAPKLAGE